MTPGRIGWTTIALLGVLSRPIAAQRHLDQYDQIFRKYSKRYFGPGQDWRIFKAQGMTESRLDPTATSFAGARGIMQLMPSTYAQIQTKQTDFAAIDDPEWNIAAGILHDRSLWRLWTDSVEADDHRDFMFGSYIAGRGTVLRAQGVARGKGYDARTWAAIVAIASDVPRWRHTETLNYVVRIEATILQIDDRGRVLPPSSRRAHSLKTAPPAPPLPAAAT